MGYVVVNVILVKSKGMVEFFILIWWVDVGN